MQTLMTKAGLAVAVVLILTCAGLGIKITRYASATTVDNGAFEAQISSMLAQQGWRVARRLVAGETGEPYPKIEFEKSGCPGIMTVAIIGRTDGLVPFLHSKYGSDLAFLQDGKVVSAPSVGRYQADQANRVARSLLAGQDGPALPALAISPSPQQSQGLPGTCRGPDAAQWASLGNRGAGTPLRRQ